MLMDEYDESMPTTLQWGEWHMPLLGFEGDEDLDQEQLVKVSVARCARVSYLTHDGKRDVEADIQLYERLKSSGHWSPFEHVAMADQDASQLKVSGNLGEGWYQYRKMFAGEVAV